MVHMSGEMHPQTETATANAAKARTFSFRYKFSSSTDCKRLAISMLASSPRRFALVCARVGRGGLVDRIDVLSGGEGQCWLLGGLVDG